MTNPDWQRVKRLFSAAVELPVDERLDFLLAECVGDEELFDEVESLLAASSEPDNLIESNSIDLPAKVGAKGWDQIEQHFGNFRIIREIGSGGMGTVFLAERYDGEFSMQVALKIVRQSVADRVVIERFKSERQILADLHHPNIAALHDGGVSEKGEPYLAMEYVVGETLIKYADQQELSIEARLELFLKVCSAVSYAHRNLVVHRDIKPSNVLVTADGQPKLLDFGLAKTFEADASATQTALRAFTPAYASPEQIQGKIITTASDIYSLGVVFYELLTGAKPLNFENQSFDEIIHTVNEIEPARPSCVETAAEGRSPNCDLRGDLDNIALTALRKEPERRFKTVDDFAADIERHLEGRPVSARPNTAVYVAGKFIRRNKVAVAAAAIVFISLLTGLATSLLQAEKARHERDRAEKRFQDVRHLSNSLLFEISPKMERLPGSVEARELLVQRALEYLDSLASESQSDNALRAELASAYEKVGDLQGNIDKPNLSNFSGALASFDKAQAIRRSLPADPDNQFRLGQNFRIASSIRNRQADVKGALIYAEQAKVLFSDLMAAGPISDELQLAAIQAEIEHGQIFAYNNRYAEAIPLFRQAVTDLTGTEQTGVTARLLTARAFSFLGNALSWDGQQPEAEAQIAKALSLADRIDVDQPNDSEAQSAVWQIYTLASSIYEDSNVGFSLDLARRALRTAERASISDKADSQATHNLARACSRIGIMLAKLGNLSGADANLQRSEKIFNDLIEREPKNLIYQRDLGKLFVRMGDTSEKRHETADALLKYENSAVIFAKIAKSDELNTLAERDLAQSLRSVGKMQIALSQFANARDTLRRAKELLDKLKEKNALGGYDQQLVDDVENSLQSI